jgi:hypothetical protein
MLVISNSQSESRYKVNQHVGFNPQGELNS